MIFEYFANLPVNFIKRIINFFYIWYIQSSKDFWNKEISFLRQMERDIGVLINLKLITEPIYGDYTYEGRVLGPIFRLGRVLVGLFIMLCSIVAVVTIYLIWIILPPLAFLMIVANLSYAL